MTIINFLLSLNEQRERKTFSDNAFLGKPIFTGFNLMEDKKKIGIPFLFRFPV